MRSQSSSIAPDVNVLFYVYSDFLMSVCTDAIVMNRDLCMQ